MKTLAKTTLILFAAIFALVLQANAADKKAKTDSAPTNTAPEASDDNAGERVNVDKIKEKYWARGEETELGVVQNRLYSKEHKIEVAGFGGIAFSDPFLSVKPVGLSVGYHFSEYLSAHLIGWKDFVNNSSALDALEASGKRANTNEPRKFLGAEGRASLLYGKLSVIGKSIIYYDMHFTAGLGNTWTENNNSLTPYAGLGQQFYLSKSASFLIDYRFMRYNDRIVEKEVTSRLGQEVGTRTNYTHSIVVGISFLFGGSGK